MEDLKSDWSQVWQQRKFTELRTALRSNTRDSDIASLLTELPTVARAAHPLVSSFYAAFETDDSGLKRESISGLVEPHWWKQKSSRWRGAATDAAVVGADEVWLCAGGLRAKGEARDFYKIFMAGVLSRGPGAYLPEADDRRLQKIEAKVARREAWTEQIRLSVMVCLAQCHETGKPRTVHVPSPAPASVGDALMHMTIDLDRVEDLTGELTELYLTISEQDHSGTSLSAVALDAARSVLEPVSDAWRVLPGRGSDQVWSALLSDDVLDDALECLTLGELPTRRSRSELRLGVQAHYARRDGMVSATIDGDAIRGLCGTWFVPTTDPHDRPICAVCAKAFSGLPPDSATVGP